MKLSIHESPKAATNSSILTDGLALLAAAGAPRKFQKQAAAGILAWKVGSLLWNKFKPRDQVLNLVIDHENSHHRWISIWMAETAPQENKEENPQFSLAGAIDNQRLVPKGTLIYRFEGVNILIETKVKPNQNPEGGIKISRYETYPSDISITFGTTNKEVVRRFLENVREVGEKHDHPPTVKVWKWHDWVDTKPIPKRMPVLPNGLFQELKDDITAFLGKKEWYESVGIPWRRGYLFYGVPGAGKTTTAIALANFLGCDIYILDLGQVSSDNVLSAMNSVPPGSILLLEDLDCAFSDREQLTNDDTPAPSTGGKLTLSTFLNALDGVATRDGRILIATTNHPELLDAAIKRRGRIDRDFHFGYACQTQIRELADRFGVPLLEHEIRGWVGISMAEVQEKLLELLNKITNQQSN